MIGTNRRLLLLAVVVLSAGLAGCLGGEDTDDDDAIEEVDDLDESELLALAEEGANDLETYQSEMTMVQELEGMDGETVVQTITFEQRVDWEERMIAQEMEMDVEGAPEQAQEGTVESYLVDETMYLREPDGEWMVQDAGDQLAGDTFWEQDELREQYDLMDEADFDVIGTEERDGAEVAVIEFEYTDELIEELQEETGDQQFSDAGAIEDGTVRQYIGVENGYLYGFEQDVTMSVLGQEVDAEMEMTVTDHNEPVDIELPDDVPEE